MRSQNSYVARMILWNGEMTVEVPVVLLQVTHFLSILATGGVLKPVTALQLTGAARGRVCNHAAGISQISLSHCTHTHSGETLKNIYICHHIMNHNKYSYSHIVGLKNRFNLCSFSVIPVET